MEINDCIKATNRNFAPNTHNDGLSNNQINERYSQRKLT
jgi:hypothetical protein